MDLHVANGLETGVTVVSNAFIDKYMAEANGEYVKVYLYLLRRGFTGVSEGEIADALNDTEKDVRRALAYWQRLGVIERPEECGAKERPGNRRDESADSLTAATGEIAPPIAPVQAEYDAERQTARSAQNGQPAPSAQFAQTVRSVPSAQNGQPVPSAQTARSVPFAQNGQPAPSAQFAQTARSVPSAQNGQTAQSAQSVQTARPAPSAQPAQSVSSVQPGLEIRPACTEQEMDSLASDAEFTQLLYIAQQYLKKIFTPKDCEVFAYLYGKLRMPSELLEYLVEYCAQNNHTSLRYIEKVALSWYERKLLTVEEAKAYSRSFSKDSFAVMKAFGLTGRSPADSEYTLLEKWYRSYGFTKELVLEACNRTMNAIHSPSFQYADKILTEWKASGVRTMRDVEELDRLRREQQEKRAGEGQKDAPKPRTGKGGRTANRFHNLEEHGYDYDKMVWNMINPGPDEEQ